MYNKRPDYPGQQFAGQNMVPAKAKRRQRQELTEE